MTIPLLRHQSLFCGAAATALALFAAPAPAQNPLVTGKSITLPPLGTQANVGSLPMNMIATPDGKWAVTSDIGFRQSLHALSTTPSPARSWTLTPRRATPACTSRPSRPRPS